MNRRDAKSNFLLVPVHSVQLSVFIVELFRYGRPTWLKPNFKSEFMKNWGRLVSAVATACIAFRMLVMTTHAQSATITVASISTTVAGSSISVSWTVSNTGVSSRTFGVGA